MDKYEKCAVCGDGFSGDDEKIYCPDCGAPMHRDCYEIKERCPVCREEISFISTESGGNGSSGSENGINMQNGRRFPDGNGCEICGRPFEENDERVYCPDCGAAMHRMCYNLTHRCPYEAEHTPRPYFTGSIRMKRANTKPVCDRCGNDLDNGEEKVYCPVCGTPVHKTCWEAEPVCPNEARHAEGYDWEKEHSRIEEEKEKQNEPDPMNDMMFDNFSDMIMQKPIRSADDGEELTCRGVKQSELVHFLGINNISTPRFFAVFMNMANSGKVISLNISAWFFMPLYHFYRRMTGPAVLLTLATFVLMVPTLILQLMQMGNAEPGAPGLPMITLANITYYIMLFMRVALLLFNDYIYMRWSVSKILSIREQYKDEPSDVYYAALEKSGNPRFMYVLGGLSLIFALVYLLNLFISASGMMS